MLGSAAAIEPSVREPLVPARARAKFRRYCRAAKNVNMDVGANRTNWDRLGDIAVDGDVYRIEQASGTERHVVRCVDGRRVGRLRGSPALMWLLEAELIDVELLRSIVRAAIEQGLLTDLPTDGAAVR